MRKIAFVALAAAALASEPSKYAYVFAVSRPEIATVDTASWRVVDRTSLPAAPAAVAVPAHGRVVYILVNGGTNADGSLPTGPSEIVVFDVAQRRIVARVEAGWGASRIVLTDDGRFVLVFRDRSPERQFERPPSIAVGVIGLFKEAQAARKPSSILVLDAKTNAVAWRKDLADDDRNVLFSRATGRFFVPDKDCGIKVIDLDGIVRLIGLPMRKNQRHYGLSPNGKWLYVVEDGAVVSETRERIKSRVYAIDCNTATLAGRVDVDIHEPVRLVDGTGTAGLGVASRSSGGVSLLEGPRVLEHVAGDFHLAVAMHDRAALVIGRKQLRFVPDTGTTESWSIDWKQSLGADPGDDIVRVPNSSFIAVPVIAFRQGPDLDRVALVDLDARRAMDSVPVGRRGRMIAKSVGLAAANAASSSSTWASAVPGPSSFDWNGFAVEMTTRTLSGAIQQKATRNPLLETSRDGQFGYAVSRFGNDLTIFRTSDASVISHVPLGGNARGVLRAPESNLICAWSVKRVTWIDSETNLVKWTDRACDGRSVATQVDAGANLIAIFGERCAGVWDASTGVRLGTVEGVGKPRLFISDATLRAQ